MQAQAQAEALGWSTGQAERVAAAAAGQLYRDFGAVLRIVPVPGHPGWVTSMHRLGPLVDAGFLAVASPTPPAGVPSASPRPPRPGRVEAVAAPAGRFL
ncbi:hypothetical protein [Streptomyces avermitilis]|uniref:hypothetical protein n=1 Tax=Streptomyces avermitilis TaxID=33903 RepID=UPI0033B32304